MLALLLIVLAAGAGLRWRGIEWPLLHPDEYKISQWATWVETHEKTINVAYPSGYFNLVKPLLLIKNALRECGIAWQCFEGHGDDLGAPVLDAGQTFVLRKLNVGFALLTVWLFYLLAWRLTRNRWAALAAAAFLACSSLHVEHSHYAETDIAMVFTFTLALYAWMRVCEEIRTRWFLAAAFLTGIAIATKYTNAILLPGALAGVALCALSRAGKDKGWRLALFLLAGTALFLAGGYCGNRHLFDSDFLPAVKGAGQAAWGERTGLLGEAVSDPLAAFFSNWDVFWGGLKELGWIWMAFLLGGFGLALSSRYRRFWPVTALPAVTYLVYFLKFAPWVRGQEFMLFLPFFAMFIAMGVAMAMARGRVMGAVVAVLVMMAIFQNGVSALRFSSLCVYPEPRIQAMKWLYTHAPLDAPVGIEEYTVPPCRLFGSACDIRQVEWLTPRQQADSAMQYLLRNETSNGRGTVNPKTHGLYPEYAGNLARFQKKARLLCQWGPAAPSYHFVGNRIEWWDAKPAAPTLDLGLPVFRPTLVRDEDDVACLMTECGVGSVSGMFVDTAPRCFVVSGAKEARRRLYVVLQTEERGGEIEINGMGDRHTVKLAPYDVAVVAVKRPWYMPRTSEYDVISVRAKARNHFRYLPCYAQVAPDPRTVALFLYQKGYPGEAMKWLGDDESWLRYAGAVESGDWPQAARLEPSARRTLGQLETVRKAFAGGVSPNELLINGCSGEAYRDHARIRLPGLDAGRDGLAMDVPPALIRLLPDEEGRVFSGRITLPVRLAPGHYTIRGSLINASSMVMHVPWTVTVTDSVSGVSESVTLVPGHEQDFFRQLTVTREQSLTLTFESSQMGGALNLSDVEVRWNQDDWFPAERQVLQRALARRAGAQEAVQPGPVFYPWLKLVDAGVTGNKGCRFEFEVLKEDPPPLKMVVYRDEGWRAPKIHEMALELKGRKEGERIAVEAPVPAGVTVSALGIRVFPAGEWISDPLRVGGNYGGRVWLGK